MTKKAENTFIGSVNKHLPEGVYYMKNNNPYLGGVPDVWYSADLRDMWVEYKFLVIPKRPTTVVDLCAGKDPMLSVLQQEWLTGRYAEGRRVAVCVGCKEGGVWLDGLSWSTPMTTQEFRDRLASRKELAEIITREVAGL